MKCISLKQPFASLIADGHKTIETRSWQTKYRGELLICSSLTAYKNYQSAALIPEIISRELIRLYDLIGEYFPPVNPLGCAVCIVNLFHVRKMKIEDEMKACVYHGDFFAWFLKDIRKVKPFSIKGSMKIFDIDCENKIELI